MEDHKNFWIGLSCFLLIVSIIGSVLMFGKPWISDELVHFEQIQMFIQGNFGLQPSLTVLPGYHWIIGSIMWLCHVSSFNAARIVTTLFLSLTLIPLFWFLCRDEVKVLQLYFFPIIFVFFFLVYTDLMSLVFVLAGVLCLFKGWYKLSGLLFILSMFVRQNNFVWLLFGVCYILIEYFSQFKINIEELLKCFKRLWVYIIGGILFGLFIIINHGLVIGDRLSHPTGFYFTNIFYILFLFFIFFLPLCLFKLKDVWLWIKAHKFWSIIIIVGSILACLLLYHNSHWYNNLEAQSGITGTGMLRNTILHAVDISVIYKLLFMIPVLLSIFVLITSKLKDKLLYLFYPFSILIVGASELVDPRYYIIPFSLFLIFRNKESDRVELYQLIYLILISILFFIGIMRRSMMW